MVFRVREAVESDCEQIRDLIVELAEYEKMPDQVKITPEVLRRDGFGKDKFFHCNVAEDTDGNKLAGYVLYYFTYSTWEGRSLYMEDLYVTPSCRGKGVGTQLWASVAKVAVEKDCQRLDWSVLGWNKPSIDYYLRQGAFDLTVTEDWHMFRMKREHIEKMAAKFSS